MVHDLEFAEERVNYHSNRHAQEILYIVRSLTLRDIFRGPCALLNWVQIKFNLGMRKLESFTNNSLKQVSLTVRETIPSLPSEKTNCKEVSIP